MKELVVGLDGSDHSRMALRWAAATAQAARIPIRTVQSWIHPRSAVLPVASVPVSTSEMDEQTRRNIAAVIAEALGPSVDVTTDVRTARPPERSSKRSVLTACSSSGPGAWAASPGSCSVR